MSLLTNKHVVVAMLVAPILAIISYFAIDAMVSETPHAAKEGVAYPLVAKPNCRYNSGTCELKNGDFELKIVPNKLNAEQLQLSVIAKHQLDGLQFSTLSNSDNTETIIEFEPTSDDRTKWSATLPTPSLQDAMRVVASSNSTFYYAQTELAFIQFETTYKEDFRQQ